MSEDRIEVEAVPYDAEADEELGANERGASSGSAAGAGQGQGGGHGAGSAAGMGGQLLGALGPVIAGMMIDLVDAATIGGLGAKLGFPIGVAAGWYISRRLPLKGRQRVWFAVGCGVYCLLPGTHMLPLGTLLGFVSRAAKVIPKR